MHLTALEAAFAANGGKPLLPLKKKDDKYKDKDKEGKGEKGEEEGQNQDQEKEDNKDNNAPTPEPEKPEKEVRRHKMTHNQRRGSLVSGR